MQKRARQKFLMHESNMNKPTNENRRSQKLAMSVNGTQFLQKQQQQPFFQPNPLHKSMNADIKFQK